MESSLTIDQLRMRLAGVRTAISYCSEWINALDKAIAHARKCDGCKPNLPKWEETLIDAKSKRIVYVRERDELIDFLKVKSPFVQITAKIGGYYGKN